ncbi:hypothetical protein SY94_5053 (plasmid) [Agrobacterium tumefaciens]|nr:hypothetical protein SY94_5053 [Agrobacterium tumefaciens]
MTVAICSGVITVSSYNYENHKNNKVVKFEKYQKFLF